MFAEILLANSITEMNYSYRWIDVNLSTGTAVTTWFDRRAEG